MNITIGIALVCAAVVMIWFARPADGVSLPWFKKAHRPTLRDGGHGHVHHGRR
jgi:hypothetical protein